MSVFVFLFLFYSHIGYIGVFPLMADGKGSAQEGRLNSQVHMILGKTYACFVFLTSDIMPNQLSLGFSGR